MFQIFADTHKIIAESVYNEVYDLYNLKLDKKALETGSILPDILPKYRFIRHYKDESLDYIADEIVKLIFASRYIEVDKILNPFVVRSLSKRLGIISHYLSDYVCLPHAMRWTFYDSMLKHIKYEKKLNEYATRHSFKKNIIDTEDIVVDDFDHYSLKVLIISYINNIIEEYLINTNQKNDMDYALNINLKLTFFILDTIKLYNAIINKQLIVQF